MVLASGEGDKRSIVRFKSMFKSSRAKVEKPFKASEDNFSKPQHCFQDPELSKNTSQIWAPKVDKAERC